MSAASRPRFDAEMLPHRPVLSSHTPHLLCVSSLSKRYGEQVALADIAFSVYPGELLGLIGPNGAGKTTLLETVAGVLPADTGVVHWQATPLPNADRRKFLFYLPDDVRPWQQQYVCRVLRFFAGVYCLSRSDVEDIVAAVGLTPVLNKRVLALSKGYMRRLIWAVALLAPHPLLLMDEPFDGFDLRQTQEMITVLRDAIAAGRTLVLSIHQLALAERVCDRFILLSDGRIRGVGSLDELRVRTGRASGDLEEIFLALT
jgi:ABC-2 type transport system ATP-binding protein